MSRRVDTQMRRAMRMPGMAKTSVRTIHERDGGICHLCGRKVALDQASRDHVVPEADGGSTRPGNLRLAHIGCNVARGDLPLHRAKDAISRLRGRCPDPSTQQVRQALVVELNRWRADRFGVMDEATG